MFGKNMSAEKSDRSFCRYTGCIDGSRSREHKAGCCCRKRERKVLADRVRRQNIICYRYTRAVVEKYNSNESLFLKMMLSISIGYIILKMLLNVFLRIAKPESYLSFVWDIWQKKCGRMQLTLLV